MLRTIALCVSSLLTAGVCHAQLTNDPFPQPIAATDGVITVNVVEFATLPDLGGVQPVRPMVMIDEPGTRRLFVNDMRGPIYAISRDGKSVGLYIDIAAAQWGVNVNSAGHNERGFQSFAFHPQFAERGTPGYGKFYTYTDTAPSTSSAADFKPGGGTHTHDTVLLEWTAGDPTRPVYDGGAPRELMRWEQPFQNHNGGQLSFNPLAAPGSPDYGLLYIGAADGGSGGDPLNLAQNLTSAFGKMLRINPLGRDSANGKYGIPTDNPYVADNDPATLGEIYASGLRNPQRFTWDPKNGNLFVADIGQNIVEELSIVTKGANLGWNLWEASYTFVSREAVNVANPRGNPRLTFPIVEYAQIDPLFLPTVAITMGPVYRRNTIPQLANLLLFGDNPSGEVFYLKADQLPSGGQDAIRRVLFNYNGESARTLLDLVRAKNVEQGKTPATRVDLRFGQGANGEIFLLNKRDCVIRMLVAG